MKTPERLSDFGHPLVAGKVKELAAGGGGERETLETALPFVRHGIPFGFTPGWHQVRASTVLGFGKGYCVTKATLFRALCGALDIPARIHFGLIDIRIMRGIFPPFVFPFLPERGSHAWTEVRVEGRWMPLDSYINDRPFYEEALRRATTAGRDPGYSVSFLDGKSSCEFNFGDLGFVHMGAVREDHGVWDDAADYFASSLYRRRTAFQTAAYPFVAVLANRRIAALRKGGCG